MPPESLQQHPHLFTTNRTDRTFFLWRLHTARPPHPGHNTILLRSEIPSGMCAKLRALAASNHRIHTLRSLYYCSSRNPVRGEPHIQRNTTGEVAALSTCAVGRALANYFLWPPLTPNEWIAVKWWWITTTSVIFFSKNSSAIITGKLACYCPALLKTNLNLNPNSNPEPSPLSSCTYHNCLVTVTTPTNRVGLTEIITIRFAGWISSRIVSLQPDTDIQKLLSNGNRVRIRYPKRFYRYFEDSDFWKKLHIAQSFVHSLSSEASFQPSVYGVISVP